MVTLGHLTETPTLIIPYIVIIACFLVYFIVIICLGLSRCNYINIYHHSVTEDIELLVLKRQMWSYTQKMFFFIDIRWKILDKKKGWRYF